MEKSTWIPLAALIAAIVVPFVNSLFQDWLKKRSERIASANPALAQPSASTHTGSAPLGASRFISRNGRWFIVFVQFFAGALALMLILVVSQRWDSGGDWLYIAFAGLLFITVQALPWVMKRFPEGRAEPSMLLAFSLRWDGQQNPHCPVDQMPLFIARTVAASQMHGEHDVLKCPKCHQEYPIRAAYLGLMTLHDAKNTIRDHIRRGVLDRL